MPYYFPFLSLRNEQSEQYSTEWPLIEVQFEKRYASRISLGYKIRTWEAKFRLYDTFNPSMWQEDVDYEVGAFVTPPDLNGYVYMCVVPGISGGSSAESDEPIWPTTEGQTVEDGQVTWVCFNDNPITALQNFVTARQGRVVSFNVWFPMLAAWVNCVLPNDPLKFIPIKSGLYTYMDVDITFTEDYSNAS
jgi:hypothetical protein